MSSRNVDQGVNRLDGPLDLVLHLTDRQVIDTDGLMVCKVDDLELAEREDGSISVTGLLAGPAALVPRYGGDHERGLLAFWKRLGIVESSRTVPWRIGLGEIERLGSGVHLRVPREGLLVKQDASQPEAGSTRRRLNDLLHMTVRGADGGVLGNVLDVRAEPATGEVARRLVITGLVVGRGHPGSFLGYDRRGDQGPWMVNKVVRWLHRHSGFVEADDIDDIDWDHEVITVAATDLKDLQAV